MLEAVRSREALPPNSRATVHGDTAGRLQCLDTDCVHALFGAGQGPHDFALAPGRLEVMLARARYGVVVYATERQISSSPCLQDILARVASATVATDGCKLSLNDFHAGLRNQPCW